jgi:hypothetical protein
MWNRKIYEGGPPATGMAAVGHFMLWEDHDFSVGGKDDIGKAPRRYDLCRNFRLW